MKVPQRHLAGITRYTDADADDLRAFQLATFQAGSRQLDAARAAWLFDRNPWRTDDATRDIWVCRRDGAIVGQQAQIPFALCVGDSERRAAWGVDLMVDGAWRLRGVGPALVATWLASGDLLGGLNLSEKGLQTFTREGWTDLGIVPVYLRPLDLRRAAALTRVSTKVARLTPVAAPALRIADHAVAAGFRAGGVRLVPVDRFDERVDDVWRSARPHHRVLARRDLEAVGWRIDGRADADRLTRHYLVVRDRTVGYVVTRLAGDEATRTAVVVDYLAPPRWVAPLLVFAGEAARGQGAVALSVKTRNPAADRYLRAAAFIRRPSAADAPIRFMIRPPDDPEADALVTDPDAWFVTSADADLDYATTPTETA